MLQTRLLYHFLVITETGSLTAAARQIGVTQPALTRSLKQLEDLIGVTLLDRHPGGVIPTAAGSILARRVKLMNIEYQNAIAEISDRDRGVAGRLRISAGPVWIVHLLPKVLQEYHRLYPNVRVTLVQGGFESQLEKLLSGEIDAMCGLTGFPAHAEIETEEILPLRQTVVARADHPLAGKPQATPADLARYPWVVLADDNISTTRIGSYFVAHGIEPPRIAIETNSLGALAITRQTDFLTTFAIQGLATLKEFGLTEIRHPGTLWEFGAGISRRRSSKAPPALRGFLGILRSVLSVQ